MHLLYSLALLAVSLALLPYFIYQALRHGKYVGSLKDRLGAPPESARGAGRSTIWVHAVSVGEFNAARPLIASLKQKMPGRRVVVSTTTLTGQQLARADFPALLDAVFYFPFDWAFIARRVIKHVSPDVVIILETELWPNFLRQCRKLSVATVIANGRISPRSFARYRRVRSFIKQVINDASLLVMQSEADRARALELGADPSRVRVCGNLKYDIAGVGDQGSGVRNNSLHDELDNQFALSSSPRLIVAGSTAPGEEKILLDTLKQVRAQTGLEDARLLIAPRHPERFNEVAGLISQSGFRLARRSQASIKGDQPEVILLDTIGELAAVYRFAAVVFVGGSLVPRGGHNIIEPALYAKPIIVGPHTENFRQIVTDFSRADALVQVSSTVAQAEDGFAREVIRLLSDRETARTVGARALDLLMKSRGATQCTVAAIEEVQHLEN
ncbi:MAG TPA: 3-deoxy-D-manno-octulosonic acid transferase [Blastocatellia bacterium]|nr:3-deoxy-D-manno-octulosonic acid transferase [Blastocatellia bacterium]